MRKYIIPLALVAVAFASCNKEEIAIPDDQKTAIEFSLSDGAGAPVTKAGFDGGSNQSNTLISARFVSTETGSTNTRMTRTLLLASPEASGSGYSVVNYNGDSYKRYWDDAYGRKGNISVYAIAVPNKPTGVTNNSVTLENKLDLSGSAVSSVNQNWKTGTENNSVQWTVTNGTQSTTTMSDEDLCYSNNIKSGGKDGRRVWGTHSASGYPAFSYDASATDKYPNCDDGQLSFKLENSTQTDGPGHFDYGHLIFYHALSRLTIELLAGDGFDMDATTKPFDFETGTTIKLHSFPTSGTLDIKSGTWASGATTSDIAKMNATSKSTTVTNSNKASSPVYELSAQMLPGYVFTDGSTTNAMSFTIDGNAYYVTQDQIFDALKANASNNGLNASATSYTMEQGKNYKLKITVSKTAIKALTCTLVDWTDVAGSFAAKNAYITFSSLTAGQSNSSDCVHFDLYRVLNLNNTVTSPTMTTFDGTSQYMTGYAASSTPAADSLSTENSGGVNKASDYNTTKKFETTWFFDTNKSFYHFRTVLPGTSITVQESTGKGDFFTMYSGPVKDWSDATSADNTISSAVGDGKVNDYHWGAIYSSNASDLKYNVTTGFNSQLAGPVGPTTSTLNIVEQHMMSNINVVLLTPETQADGSTDAVDMVDLFNSATGAPRVVSEIKITNFSGSATVRMGNGLVTPSTSFTASAALTTPTYSQEGSGSNASGDYCKSKSFQFGGTGKKYYQTQAYTYRVVPQELVTTSGSPAVTNKVGLTIQTPDDNMYYVVEDLSNITVSSVSGNSLKKDHTAGEKIQRWYPGYTYTYYFILTKTGIEALTCTIVDWVDVQAAGQDINLES